MGSALRGLLLGLVLVTNLSVSTISSQDLGNLARPDSIHAAGDLDASFDPRGGALVATSSNIILVQPDGKILIGGRFNAYHGVAMNGIARANSDGSVDTSFTPGDGIGQFFNGVNDIALQPDGRIILVGDFLDYRGIGRNRIVRINSDGSLDLSFDPGTGADDDIDAVALQPDGKILIAGYFDTYNGASRRGIARLNSNGSVDTSFNPGSGTGVVRAMALQADGKVIIGGQFTSYNGTPRNRLVRLNADGSLDTTFDPGTGPNDLVLALAVQADGKTLIGGSFTNYRGTNRSRIARVNGDGTLDTGFAPGTGADSLITAITIQPDGRAVFAGAFTSYNGTTRQGIVRAELNGSVDTTFDPGSGIDFAIITLARQADGKILMGGPFAEYNGLERSGIARANANGSSDASFDPGTGVERGGLVVAVRQVAGGKVMLGGSFTSYGGRLRGYVARANADGTVDTSFNPGTGLNGPVKSSFVVQPDGKILIGGNFSTFNGAARRNIVRVNTDGSLDISFNGPTDISEVTSIALQSDGKIIIAGTGTITAGLFLRLNPDGSIDTSFNTGAGANSSVYGVAVQPDGKIVLGGAFTSFNGTPRISLARVNPDGTLDSSLNPGAGTNGYIRTVVLQPDGRILLRGNFTSYNNVVRNYIARANADGSLDVSFNPGSGLTGDGGAISDFSGDLVALQADGRIIVGGDFSAYNGASRRNLVRVNSDGSVDATFDPGTGPNETVMAVSSQADGNVLIGGGFTRYQTATRITVARVLGGNTSSPSVIVTGRVLTPSMIAIRNAPVTLIDASGIRRTVTTSSFGVYTFADVAPGNYTIIVTSKRYRFTPLVRLIDSDLTNLDLVGLE